MKHAAILLSFLSAGGVFASETALAHAAKTTTAPVAPPVAPVVAPAPAFSLVLKPQASSTGDEILLSEIVEAPAGGAPAWLNTPVTRAGAAGQTRIVYTSEITNALRRAGIADTVEIAGSNDCRVTALSQAIPAADVDAAIVDSVRKFYSADSDLEVTADVLSQQPFTPIRPGPIEVSVDIPEAGLRPTTQSLRVRIMQNGRRVAEAAASVRIKVNGSIAVAAERLPVNTVITESDIKTVRKDLSASDLLLRGDANDLIGLRVKQMISAGGVVHRKLLAAPLVIKRGDPVAVVVRRGGLELHSTGEARGDAALNESVRIFIPDSNAEVVGRAAGPREVALDAGHTQGSK